MYDNTSSSNNIKQTNKSGCAVVRMVLLAVVLGATFCDAWTTTTTKAKTISSSIQTTIARHSNFLIQPRTATKQRPHFAPTTTTLSSSLQQDGHWTKRPGLFGPGFTRRTQKSVASSTSSLSMAFQVDVKDGNDKNGPSSLLQSIGKKIHNPVTYFLLLFSLAFRYNSLFRNLFFWIGCAFCIKWYRARYVFKIPVWDRQPNWNNVITSKEQEKGLHAITCKNCGATIFPAKSREFYFEGTTGIGGLGCFSCGAKGKDNFIMDDRDRIVQDVGDMDDYFEYEKPLDFVSRGERRKLLQQTGGDEEQANQLLLNRFQNQQQQQEVGNTQQPSKNKQQPQNSSSGGTKANKEAPTSNNKKGSNKTKATPSKKDDDLSVLELDDF